MSGSASFHRVVPVAALLLVAVAAVRPAHATDDAAQRADARPRVVDVVTPPDVLLRVRMATKGDRLRAKPLEGARGWSVPLAYPKEGGAAWPTPATDGERVYAGGPVQSREIFAFDALTGKRRWTATLDDNGPTPPVVREGHVYANTQSCTLYALDAASGRARWSVYLSGHLESGPAVGSDVIAATRPDLGGRGAPALTVLDRAGRVLHDVEIDAEAWGAPVLAGGRAYVASRSGTLWCVDAAEGRTAWKRRCGARGAPWVDAAGVYVATETALLSFDPATGRERWTEAAITPSTHARELVTTDTSTPRPAPLLRPGLAASSASASFCSEGARPVVIKDTVCVAEQRSLRFFDRVSAEERAELRLDVREPIAGPPLVSGDTVVVATRGGEVRAIDVRDSVVVWAVDIGAPLGSGITMDRGRLLAVTADGHLVSVETGDLRADGWPMWTGTADGAFDD